MFRPSAAYYTTLPAAAWLESKYPSERAKGEVLECTQRAGDVVYVPRQYGHATLNTQESIGVAQEFEFLTRSPTVFRNQQGMDPAVFAYASSAHTFRA
jgi:hypothetical protein